MGKGRNIAWRSFPNDSWLELIRADLKSELNVTEEEYINKFKTHILRGIALSYWNSLLNFADKGGLEFDKEKETVESAVCRRLGIVRGQAYRWALRKICPDSPTIFGAVVIALQKEIHEVGFPRYQEAVWEAVSQNIWRIRRLECKKDWREDLTRQEYAYVWWLVRHPHSAVFLGEQMPSTEVQVFEDVLIKVREEHPDWNVKKVGAVSQAFIEWTRPYLLFHFGLIEGWESLDVKDPGAVRESNASDR